MPKTKYDGYGREQVSVQLDKELRKIVASLQNDNMKDIGDEGAEVSWRIANYRTSFKDHDSPAEDPVENFKLAVKDLETFLGKRLNDGQNSRKTIAYYARDRKLLSPDFQELMDRARDIAVGINIDEPEKPKPEQAREPDRKGTEGRRGRKRR